MSLIVAARFQTFEEAQGAAHHLFERGYSEDDIHTFYVNTAGEHGRFPLGGDRVADADSRGAHTGAIVGAACVGLLFAVIGSAIGWGMGGSTVAIVAGAGVGAYVGSLWGALWVTGRGKHGRTAGTANANPEVRQAGVLLALHISPEREQEACRLLLEAGGVQVERAHGRWSDGKWQDFDALEPPQQIATAAPHEPVSSM